MKNKGLILLLAIIAVFAGVFVYFKNTTPYQGSLSQTANSTSANPNSDPNADSATFRTVPFEKSILIKPHSPIKGAFSAKATLVEFLDPECEACAATYPYVKKIAQEFEKDLQIVVRYMPYHRNSKYVANILEGARAQNKYWEALDLLFATQSQWADHHNPKPELIPLILKPLGLNMDKIVADARAGKYDAQINEDFEDGKKVGVRGTPTFFVNGTMLDELSYDALKSSIERAVSN